MVDTQLPMWQVSFGLNPVDMAELDDHSHSFDIKPYTTVDYSGISNRPYDYSPPERGNLTELDCKYDFKLQQYHHTSMPPFFHI